MGEIILVDKDDKVIGYGEKETVHKNGILHRAFSIFLYDLKANKILIQKRAANKYHSGNLWSNSCCSHPYRNETWIGALKRCVYDELGVYLPFENCIIYKEDDHCSIYELTNNNSIEVGTFQYFSNYGEMKEHEIDHVVVCCLDKKQIDEISPNLNEVSEIKWVSIIELEKMFNKDSKQFTSWFSDAYQLVKKIIK